MDPVRRSAGGGATGGGDAPGGGGTEPVVATGGDGVVRQPGELTGNGDGGGAEAIPDDERIPSFVGRVSGPDGRPLGGATVEAFGMLGWAVELPSGSAGRADVHWSTTTAADGSFRLPEPPREGLRFLLRVRSASAATLLVRNLPASPGRTRDLGTLRMTAGRALRGVVQDAAGEPVADAEVQAFRMGDSGARGTATTGAPLEGALATSGADGSFTFENLPLERLRLRARAAGRAEGWSDPLDSTTGPGHAAVARSRELRGRVVHPDRTSIAGAAVVFARTRASSTCRRRCSRPSAMPTAASACGCPPTCAVAR